MTLAEYKEFASARYGADMDAFEFIVNGRKMFVSQYVSPEIKHDQGDEFVREMLMREVREKCEETWGKGTLTNMRENEYQWTTT